MCSSDLPEQIIMGDGQLVVKLESKDKNSFTTERIQNGETIKVSGFIPKKEKVKEDINIQGRIFSMVPVVKPGNYRESVKIKAFYEYLDYTIENRDSNKKVVIRR